MSDTPYINDVSTPVRGFKEDPSDPHEIATFGKRSATTDRQEVDAYVQSSASSPVFVEPLRNDRDPNNEQTSPLLAGQTFLGNWTRIDKYLQFQVLYAATTPLTSVAIEWSNDGVTQIPAGEFGSSAQTPRVVSGYNVVYYIGTVNQIAPYYRLRVVNGGTDQGASPAFISLAWLGNHPYSGAFGFLEDVLTNLSKALLVRAVQAGHQPDGDFVNLKADGLLFQETDALGSAGSFVSSWYDTDGWASVELAVETDQVSAADGIVVDFTDDSGAGTPTVRVSRTFTFTADDAARGFAVYRFPAELDGLRITYTNGGTGQGSFFLAVTLRTQSVSPQGALEQTLGPTNVMTMTRGPVLAKNDSGAYANITRGTAGGFRVSIKEHEAETPLKALTAIQVTRTTIPTSPATKVVSVPFANRKTISLKAICGGSTFIAIGHSSAVTSANGFPLSNDQSIDLDLDGTVDIWAISSSGSNAVAVVEVS